MLKASALTGQQALAHANGSHVAEVSTHKNYYTGECVDMRSNPGMIADSTKLKRMLMEK